MTPSSRFTEMARWLDMNVEARRKETMPAIFRESSNIDGLCHSCRSIPWSHIRQVALERIKDLDQKLPKTQRQFNSGSYHREEIYKHVSMTTKDTADTAIAGCHLCTLVLFVLFSRTHNKSPIQLASARVMASLAKFDTRALGTSRPYPSLASWECGGRMELIFAVGRAGWWDPVGLSVLAKVPEHSSAEYADLSVAIDPALSSSPCKADRENPSTTSSCAYWLNICTKGHKKCTEDEESAPSLPKRVIRVNRESGVTSARLCSAAGQKSRYAALSHRWSSSCSAQLTSESIQEFEQAISLSELSRTFIEAFEIILDVGLEYIWIDSLCIIQDSKEDWAQQSACMSNIYGQAYLTLCAFTAENGTGFCSANFESNLINTSCQVAQGMYAYPYPKSSDRLSAPEGTAKTRAWIMQEEMLSKRKLYCGKKGVMWVCKSMHSKTAMPCATALTEYTAFRSTFVNPFEPFTASSPSASKEWKLLICAYTRCRLSYQSDKLPALSAVADRFGKCAAFDRSDYLAGHWRQHLPDSLLWWMHDWSPVHRRNVAIMEDPPSSRHNNAPSWSWASRDKPVEFFHWSPSHCTPDLRDPALMLMEDSRLLRATTVHKTSNPFGEVSSGILRLRGMILRDAYQAIEKIKDAADSNVDQSVGKREPLDAILFQIERRAGLLLERVQDLNGEYTVYKRIGICFSSQDTLGLIFKDGHWEQTIVEIV